MSENSENKEMKTSGLRPPTKIPSMGVSRIPSSSSIKLDGVKSTTVKLDGGSSVKKTADMPYASKYNGLYKNTIDERKSSSSSDSFMGDARRLSEAGVRRSSGNSVVLTEDTDKFIIGNRIWVGGTKPGQIAYIGETNFGTGDWAGIVLDEPIGKNDGSVGGTRYFQCEPKKGIFARLTNLTFTPLSPIEDSMAQSSFAATKPLGFSTPMAKRQGSTVTASKIAPKSINQQPISKSSSDLKIGDRVIISSGQGSKLGVLKYRGATQFAPGEWCGIELDDPLGKNNGTVEGIQYFECEDKFGLFAPIAKVSKSPMSASRMSTNCAIHKAKRSPGSMNGSMVSGMTSNTMSSIPTRQAKVSDLDRLKLQLTQMKNENELLRSQVTKAANQADAAEKRLEETLKAQVDKPLETQVNSIEILQNQIDNLKKQIDEEKEKFQNLQFTNEEQNVVNIELQNKNAELLIKIKELEFDLDKERNLAKDIEKETMKIFEKEEELCRIKEELESLKKVINNNEDELQKSVSNLSSEVVDKEAELNTLRQKLNENSQIHERLLKESNEKLFATTDKLNKIIEEKDKKIEQHQEMIDQLNEGIKCLSALKNEEHDDIVNNLNNELSKLKNEFKIIIDKKEQDIKISQENVIKVENELKQELKSQLEGKNQEIELLKKKNTDLMIQISSEENNIETLKSQLHTTSENLKELKINNLMYSKESLESVLEQEIKLTFIKIEDLNKKFGSLIVLKDKQIETCNTAVTNIKEHLLNSKSSLEITLNDEIKKKNDEILTLSEKLNIMTINIEKLEKTNEDVNLELKRALKSVQEKITIIEDLEEKYNKLDSQQQLNRNELEKKLKTELESVNDELACLKLEKSKLDEQHENLLKSSANATIEMENKLKDGNNLIENLNKTLNELTLSKKNELDSLKKQLLQLEEDREQILKNQHLELASKDEIINTLSNKLDQTLTEKQKQDLNNANLHAELTNEVTKYQTSIKELQSKINELEINIASNQESYKNDLELSNKEKESFKLENLNLIEKVKSLENSKLNLEEKLKSIEVCRQDIQNLNDAIIEKNKTIDDYQMKLKQLDDLIKQNKNEFEVIIKKKEEEIKELSKVGEEKMQMEKLSLEEKTKFILNEKDKENSILHKKIEDLENIKISFEKQLEVNKLQEQDLKKLNDTIKQKIKMIEDNNLMIEQLNNRILLNQNEYEAKLQKKEIEIVELLKVEEEKLNFEKEQMEKQIKVTLDEKSIENSNLLEKITILENTEKSIKEQLEIYKTQENLVIDLKKSIEEKTKIIGDNDSKIEQLNKMILTSKEEFDSKLKEKEGQAKQLLENEKQKFIDEKCTLEQNSKIILNNKDTEILNLVEKLNVLENIKLNFEKELEISKTQESDIIELKKVIEEKTKVIDDNNLKVEQLNNLIAQIKEDFDMKLKEKENKIEELVKFWEEKLNVEKIASETRITTCLGEKNTEIEVLKTRLQEFVENNTEKELMLKLEFVNEELEKEKIRASSLETLKSELEKTVLNHKTELEQMEISRLGLETEMTKMVEELQNLKAKIKAESDQLDDEKLQIQKQIDELKIECSVLKSTLNEKNNEIENLKAQSSQNSKTNDSNNDELNQLKALLERDRSSQSHLEFRIQELTDENHRLNERIEGDTSLLQKNHNIIQEKYNIEKKYEETYSMLKIKENQILVLQTELNSWKLKDMEKSKNDNSKEKTEKTETLLLAEKNEEIKMLNSIILGLHKKLSAVMESDVTEFDIENNPSTVSKEDYQKLYKTAKNNVKLKECENLSLKQEIYKLKTENDRFSELKTKCESLENDKKTLQKLIVNYESSHPVSLKNENSNTKSETAKILEEKDWQINLLNNIIADLHAKVSDNKFKIEALEKQIMDSGMNQNKKVRIRTTRLYCEQCEIFDSHDTEDCPEKPESPKFQRKRRVVNDNTNKTTEEPFCVCCDMFGHTANECDSSLTF